MGRDLVFLKFSYKLGGREKDVVGEGDKMMKDLVSRKRFKFWCGGFWLEYSILDNIMIRLD